MNRFQLRSKPQRLSKHARVQIHIKFQLHVARKLIRLAKLILQKRKNQLNSGEEFSINIFAINHKFLSLRRIYVVNNIRP
jgi:hypothetical protein